VARNAQSHTGRFLAKALANGNGAAKRPGNNGAATGRWHGGLARRKRQSNFAGALMRERCERRLAFTFLVSLFNRDALAVSRGNFQQTQNPSGKPPQRQSSKVQNPLNDLLD